MRPRRRSSISAFRRPTDDCRSPGGGADAVPRTAPASGRRLGNPSHGSCRWQRGVPWQTGPRAAPTAVMRPT
eukprot:2355462-Alexandrium_andersonii.AAC.1